MATNNVRWLEDAGPETLSDGISFGMPWSKGQYQRGDAFVIEGDGQQYPLDTREIAYWADGSLKWTAHSVSSNISYSDQYTVRRSQEHQEPLKGAKVERNGLRISVSSRQGLHLTFCPPGSSSLLESLAIDGRVVCTETAIVASIGENQYTSRVDTVEIENATFARVVVKASGVVVGEAGEAHLPFDMRVYVYSDASSVKILHSFIHDLEPDQSLTSLGLRFTIPLSGSELYNRHVRLGGSDGGILKEEVQGLTGLRYGPTTQNRLDQAAGQAVTLREDEWAKTDLKRALSCIPSWDSYSLSQLSSDGFTVKKRTKEGCSWVKVTGGGRADGISYLGSARHGGLAVGISEFWERYPTQLDLSNLTTEEGSVTIWLYSPLAEPLETMQYHAGLGLDSYAKQLEALDVTYEDYEPGFATANGIGRTSQLFLKPYSRTPSNQELSSFSTLVRRPPHLVATAAHMYSTGVFHGSWSPDYHTLGLVPTTEEVDIERNLDLLFNFYHNQVEQSRWYGFWDYGDVQHTYDSYRHAWRYDVGGYAWDNSELSTDLWLWLYFLHTGRPDVFRMAEAMTRHTSEVDIYHAGRFKGFGTRHGVQHFSDSSKQLRISNVLYRRIYFYLTGDERSGDLIRELQECQKALLVLDSHRKVQKHADIPEGFAMANIGLDCGALIAAWLTAWERRTEGWDHARSLLLKLMEGISALKHGIGNNAILLNVTTGEVASCPPPTPEYAISHLSMLFGFPEIVAELFDYTSDENLTAVKNFREVWLRYCRAYNGGPDVQLREYGFEFPAHATWRQSHSTLTAAAAKEQAAPDLGHAAWRQFFDTDGYSHDHLWTILKVSPPAYFNTGNEAPWVRTNEAARYGISAISNLANIREYLK